MEGRKQYIQFTEPDKASLGKLLGECKGKDRTMAQLGEDAKLSPSMLSRILNGNITKPLPEETLQAIFDHKAPGCTVTIDDLYRANGMVTVEERNRMAHGVDYQRIIVETKEKAQQIIINSLLMRGYAVKADISQSIPKKTLLMESRTDRERGDLLLRYDLGITLPEMHDLSEWVFDIFSSPIQRRFGDRDYDPEREAKFQIRRSVQMHSNVFLVDAWQPERLEGMKYSFVFTDHYMYDAFKDYVRTAKLNNAMSIIQIDTDEKRVVKEEWLNCPMKDDYASLFRDVHDGHPGTDYEYRPEKHESASQGGNVDIDEIMDGEDTE